MHRPLLLSLLLCTAAPALADEAGPRARCTATRSGRRVVVRPEVEGLVDAELARLVRLGLSGRLEVTVTLLRRRPLWFDARVETVRLTQVLAYTAEGGWVLDGRPLSAPPSEAALPLERVALGVEARREEGDVSGLVVEVEARLQVVTAQSLGRVASWLTPSGAPERTAVGENLVRSVAEDLARSARGRCEVTARGATAED
jgi:hypothetical protein